MDKIVIIGANDFQNQLILKAKSMGFETHVFAWKDGSIGETTADYFYPISIIEKEKILEVCKSIQPVAVTSIASDLAVITVNYVAEKLGLMCNGIKTNIYTTNKFEMRKRLKQAYLPIPEFFKINNIADLESIKIEYPMIVKPTDRSGSRGVTKVNNIAELTKAVEYAISFSFDKEAIVEKFLPGEEYSCEAISFQGKHTLLALTKKYTTGSPHYIETGHMQPSGLSDEMYEKVNEIVEKALNALDIKVGASHTEIKIDDNGNIGIIEIGARMGGDCIGSDMVYLSTGYDYLSMVIDTACGKEYRLIKEHQDKAAYVRFIFDHSDMELLDQLEKNRDITVVRKVVNHIPSDEKVVDSSTRFGYLLFTTENHSCVKELLGWR